MTETERQLALCIEEVEETIQILEEQANDKDFIQTGGTLQIKSEKIKLQALREKQERDKGCEWCRQTGDAKPGEKKFLHATQYVVSGDGSVHYIKNSYCGNCGKKLEE